MCDLIKQILEETAQRKYNKLNPDREELKQR
jgi:hypothetical protein